MQIDLIDNIGTFKEIRKNWDSIYKADPQAQFFLSWVWLSGWLPMVGKTWFVLAAKSGSEDSYVAFLPLQISLEHKDKSDFDTELYMAGNSMADYTGLICLPGLETEVIPAFAVYIQQKLSWSTFNLQNILETDRRMHLFLKCFFKDRFEVSQYHIQYQHEDTDQNIAPYLSLVDDWDLYLQNYVSSNTRQKIRRFLRKVENSSEFNITHVNVENLESHIEILLRFWESKWRDRKGDLCDPFMDYLRRILRHCFQNNCLYLPVLWKGNKPIGAIANYIDVQQKSMLFAVASRDGSCQNPPPGFVLHADAIRYAIQNGFKVYDFLRGNEKYKYSFGTKERRILQIVIKDKNSLNRQLDVKIDVKSLQLALQLIVNYHRANRLTEAEQGYRQILKVESNYPEALYGLAVLMRQKGEFQTAKQLLKKLLQNQPKSIKALLCLGNLYQTQDQLQEAIEVYNQVIALQPNAIAAYNNLGYALQQQGKWSDAICCYQKALELKPDCLEAEVNKANILYAQGKLSSDRQAHYATLNNDLGSQSREVGDIKTAIAYYQQSILMNPNLSEAKRSLELLLENQAEMKA